MLNKYFKICTQIQLLLAGVLFASAGMAREDQGTVRGVDVANKIVVIDEASYEAQSPVVIHDLNDDSTTLVDLSKLTVGTPVRAAIDEGGGRAIISEIWILRGDHSETE